MEPLKPYERQAILANRPNAEPGDIQEYEQLLSRRFTIDPDFAPAGAPEFESDRTAASEKRIAELREKLFGTGEETSLAEHS